MKRFETLVITITIASLGNKTMGGIVEYENQKTEFLTPQELIEKIQRKMESPSAPIEEDERFSVSEEIIDLNDIPAFQTEKSAEPITIAPLPRKKAKKARKKVSNDTEAQMARKGGEKTRVYLSSILKIMEETGLSQSDVMKATRIPVYQSQFTRDKKHQESKMMYAEGMKVLIDYINLRRKEKDLNPIRTSDITKPYVPPPHLVGSAPCGSLDTISKRKLLKTMKDLNINSFAELNKLCGTHIQNSEFEEGDSKQLRAETLDRLIKGLNKVSKARGGSVIGASNICA